MVWRAVRDANMGMKRIKICCSKMKDAIEHELIDLYGSVSIHWEHRVCDDDGNFSTISEDRNIAFCPFCGKKIEF